VLRDSLAMALRRRSRWPALHLCPSARDRGSKVLPASVKLGLPVRRFDSVVLDQPGEIGERPRRLTTNLVNGLAEGCDGNVHVKTQDQDLFRRV
jgi:hypothetical protein